MNVVLVAIFVVVVVLVTRIEKSLVIIFFVGPGFKVCINVNTYFFLSA